MNRRTGAALAASALTAALFGGTALPALAAEDDPPGLTAQLCGAADLGEVNALLSANLDVGLPSGVRDAVNPGVSALSLDQLRSTLGCATQPDPTTEPTDDPDTPNPGPTGEPTGAPNPTDEQSPTDRPSEPTVNPGPTGGPGDGPGAGVDTGGDATGGEGGDATVVVPDTDDGVATENGVSPNVVPFGSVDTGGR